MSINVLMNEFQVTSGLPQGYIFGLVLFLLIINDFPDDVPLSTLAGLYADNTTLIKAIPLCPDCYHPQGVLSYEQNKRSNFDFNASKCEWLTISCQKARLKQGATFPVSVMLQMFGHRPSPPTKPTLRDRPIDGSFM